MSFCYRVVTPRDSGLSSREGNVIHNNYAELLALSYAHTARQNVIVFTVIVLVYHVSVLIENISFFGYMAYIFDIVRLVRRVDEYKILLAAQSEKHVSVIAT